MVRILFISGRAEGHINLTLGVVKELVSRGEEVVYITAEPFADRISQTSLRSDSEGSFFFNHFSFLKNSIFAVLSYAGVLFGGKFRVALFCSGLIE